MSTIDLSRRALVTATAALPALAMPAAAIANPATPSAECTLPPDLIERFVRVRACHLDVESRSDTSEAEISAVGAEGWDVAAAMLACKPQTVTDLAWQLEAYLIAEHEILQGDANNGLIGRYFRHIRALGGVPQPDDPLGVLHIPVNGDEEA